MIPNEIVMKQTHEGKLSRLNIRISEHQKDIIARAASTRNTTVSDFVLEQAYAEALSIVADQSQFSLDERRWKKFCKALDAPPKGIPALKELLSKPSVFDE